MPDKMVSEKFKHLLEKHAQFIWDVYNAKSLYIRKKTIQQASESQLDTLILVLHHLFSGNIPIRKSKWPDIVKSKRVPKIIKHCKHDNVHETLKLPEREKRVFLNGIPCFSKLLFNLFNLH